MSANRPRIGIFGGTFNPIHLGHLIMAETAYEQFELESVIFLPTGHAPHKAFMGEEMSVHREQMVKLAIDSNPHFSYSDYEISNDQVNYTYKTLDHFRELYPDHELFFILGADSLFDFETWMNPAEICKKATILVAVRADLIESRVDEQIALLESKYNGVFHRLTSPNFDVSSKNLRKRVQEGSSIRYMVKDEVMEHILANRLYLTVEQAADHSTAHSHVQ